PPSPDRQARARLHRALVVDAVDDAREACAPQPLFAGRRHPIAHAPIGQVTRHCDAADLAHFSLLVTTSGSSPPAAGSTVSSTMPAPPGTQPGRSSGSETFTAPARRLGASPATK